MSNRLAYRIVRTIGNHWPQLESGILWPEEVAQAQLRENHYFPLHPEAVAYYKGDHVPMWPWFEDKVRLAIEQARFSCHSAAASRHSTPYSMGGINVGA